MIFDIPDAAVAWLQTGNRGVSSEAIFAAMTGLPLNDWGSPPPRDPSDLNRCRVLLERVPEWSARFDEMRDVEGWERLVDEWPRICALIDEEAPEWRFGVGSCPRAYAAMKEIGL